MKHKKVQFSRLPGLSLLWIALFLLSSGLVVADPAFAQGNALQSARASIPPRWFWLLSPPRRRGARSRVAWSTEIEQFNSGFNLYRAVHGTNQFIRLNGGLIPSQVQQGTGQRCL